MTTGAKERFLRKTCPEPNSGCLLWLGSAKRSGHGGIRFQKKYTTAHRVAWESFVGPIPDGLCVLHKCDNPPCVNVRHLFLGTLQDNAIDMAVKGRGRKNSRDMPTGVYRSGSRFGAHLTVDGRSHYIGSYATVGAAAVAVQGFKDKYQRPRIGARGVACIPERVQWREIAESSWRGMDLVVRLSCGHDAVLVKRKVSPRRVQCKECQRTRSMTAQRR